MTTTPTSSATAISAAIPTAPGSSRLPVQTLSQQDFLNLVTSQMANQDPLNPQSNTEFISQMAQFSALEQSKSMQQEMQMVQANGLLGRMVALQDAQGNAVAGTVSAIQMQAGTPQIVVNGQVYDMSTVLSIGPATTNP